MSSWGVSYISIVDRISEIRKGMFEEYSYNFICVA